MQLCGKLWGFEGIDKVSEAAIAATFARASKAAFGKPLVTNVLRGLLVEAIIADTIEPEWLWCAADYSSWDFERADGMRLEVKHSSYLQTWAPPTHGKVSPSFDIRERSGRWEGAVFIEDAGRAAHLYAFAYHDVRDETADHRDPEQWAFFVVPTSLLPKTKRLSLARLKQLAAPISIDQLCHSVASVSAAIMPNAG